MRHAREDYNRIQDPEEKIPEDEPVFLIRAQDVVAPAALENYATMAELVGADPKLVNMVREWAEEMRDWQATHEDDVKPADL